MHNECFLLQTAGVGSVSVGTFLLELLASHIPAVDCIGLTSRCI